MEWISVKDRLPDVNIADGDFTSSKKVLAIIRNTKGDWWCESMYLKTWIDDSTTSWHYDYDLEPISLSTPVTHWMPLPEPPQINN